MKLAHDQATRAQGLERLNDFAPLMGSHYAGRRNIDAGGGRKANVSQLSPFLRHRLISEPELVSAAITVHGAEAAFKFVQEVCWRTYFNGWLEHHPAVWSDFCISRDCQLESLEKDNSLKADYNSAIEGNTGIEGFDDWARELRETGYLHNHARMSFASIWLFTLRLPWALGSDLFLQHLLDGDPASNTLSWRWVAGLHTPGKTYLAKKEAIETCSDGRFSPKGLADRAPAVDGPANPAPSPLPPADTLPQAAFALLLTEDDLSVERWIPETLEVESIAAIESASFRSPHGASRKASAFTGAALNDGAHRAGVHFGAAPTLIEGIDAEALLLDWAARLKTRLIVVPYMPAGWGWDRLSPVLKTLQAEGFEVRQVRRDWDEVFWPHARKGYFKLRKQIPSCLDALGIAEGQNIDG
ncbi:MAG: hypothetical protein CME85_10175 [Henriciella sp.]|jgi:deoxyribodipyrimidine photo-lyase|uniref:FAD-binding domain-containing protein n=1 Tax=Henriciella sp. TaxID=1968823 RepID=UPI000C0E1BBB|nr:FAD-binding domain-containing protein [Henriciella sp.]MBF33988.1 hypothetical protein [Hyphomonadaceae bacterium]MBK75849.1 hypothetical protein [Henriciella sp.]PHR80189.1 MAG: hypothetical protein COA64_04125 [Henriciella sp.]|tara:strand:- start:61 stop:1302 length:1242 start_codon:yes stop_codon:yes gene_type:complete